MSAVKLHDKTFIPSIYPAEIRQRIAELAEKIDTDTKGEVQDVLVILKGAAIFGSDLVRALKTPCRIHFAGVSSYGSGMTSGQLRISIPLPEKFESSEVLIVEDIVDSGKTLDYIITAVQNQRPNSIRTCSLLYKPEAHKGEHQPDYVAFEVGNDFVVGYGLDYDQLGSDLDGIYTLSEA